MNNTDSNMIAQKILLIDDDVWVTDLIGKKLTGEGYTVAAAINGKDALELSASFKPDAVLTDINMPVMDGYEFIRLFKKMPGNMLIPVIILSALGKETDILKGFEYGADNYMLKPINPALVSANIKNALQLVNKFSSINTLTKLPGNEAISVFINSKLAEGVPFVFCYLDLDNFKAFNDYYGFSKGDEVILFCADLLKKYQNTEGVFFTGHIGGDDFILIAGIHEYEKVLSDFIVEFDRGIPSYYTAKDRERGYIEAANRQGLITKFPLISLSIGAVPTNETEFHSIVDISDTAIEVKKKAKSLTGSHYFINKRKEPVKVDRDKLKQIKILISPRSSVNLRIIGHIIRPFGFTVIESGDARENFLNEYKLVEPDILFIDEETDIACALIKEIRAHETAFSMPRAFVLVMSKTTIDQARIGALIGAGADNIISIPVKKEQILQKIKEILIAKYK